MKRTLTEQYGLIKKGKGHKDVFLKAVEDNRPPEPPNPQVG